MITFFDFETQGLPDFNKRARDESQPHIVQLAAMLTNDTGEIVESHECIVKPDGWTIPKEASDLHGITDVVAQVGLPEKLVAELLFAMVKKSALIVAHNITFDKFIARIALRRFEIFTDAEDPWWKALPTFCTMREMTSLCKIPHPSLNSRFGFKWPTLQESHRHAFGKPFDGAHRAMADVIACKDIYFWMQNQNNPKPTTQP
jgi:DNA polymerase-3 subunit epsilon